MHRDTIRIMMFACIHVRTPCICIGSHTAITALQPSRTNVIFGFCVLKKPRNSISLNFRGTEKSRGIKGKEIRHLLPVVPKMDKGIRREAGCVCMARPDPLVWRVWLACNQSLIKSKMLKVRGKLCFPISSQTGWASNGPVDWLQLEDQNITEKQMLQNICWGMSWSYHPAW